jgi:hypothetical protein
MRFVLMKTSKREREKEKFTDKISSRLLMLSQVHQEKGERITHMRSSMLLFGEFEKVE